MGGLCCWCYSYRGATWTNYYWGWVGVGDGNSVCCMGTCTRCIGN